MSAQAAAACAIHMVAREVWEGCADCPGDAKKLWEAAARLLHACAGEGRNTYDRGEDSQGVFGSL